MREMGASMHRATNAESLGILGDPERWGGVGDVVVHVATGAARDTTAHSTQIVRAQCADLIARAWSIGAEYSVDGRTAGDQIALALHVVWGSGSVASEGYAELPLVAVVPSAAFPWLSSPAGGCLMIPQQIPAAALAIRARMRVVSSGADPDHDVVARVKVCVAPRSL